MLEGFRQAGAALHVISKAGVRGSDGPAADFGVVGSAFLMPGGIVHRPMPDAGVALVEMRAVQGSSLGEGTHW